MSEQYTAIGTMSLDEHIHFFQITPDAVGRLGMTPPRATVSGQVRCDDALLRQQFREAIEACGIVAPAMQGEDGELFRWPMFLDSKVQFAVGQGVLAPGHCSRSVGNGRPARYQTQHGTSHAQTNHVKADSHELTGIKDVHVADITIGEQGMQLR